VCQTKFGLPKKLFALPSTGTFSNFTHNFFLFYKKEFKQRKKIVGFDLASSQKTYVRYKLTKFDVKQ
jgi:hypothetical protein